MSFRDARTLGTSIGSTYREALELSDENQSRLAQLMTIWVSGYIEVICKAVLLTYTEKKSDEIVAKFVGQILQKMRNPRTKEISDLVRSFDKGRADELKEFFQGRIKESVDSVVALRNEIAHGRPPAHATIANVKKQFDDSREFATKLKELFGVDT